MWADLARSRLRKHVASLHRHEAALRLREHEKEEQEDVHQMRVATRRLRAGVRLLQAVLPSEPDALRGELRWLGAALGRVRDLDVQLVTLRGAAAELAVDAASLGPLVCCFETRRCQARQELQRELDGERYAALVDALDSLVEAPWPRAARLNGGAVADLIRRRRRKLRKAAATLHATSCLEEVHLARIRTKQLRYALELFAPRYGKRARRVIRRAVRLQDLLGTVHDAAVLRARLAELSQADPRLSPESMALIGHLDAACAQRASGAQARAPKAYARLTGKAWKRLDRRMRAAA